MIEGYILFPSQMYKYNNSTSVKNKNRVHHHFYCNIKKKNRENFPAKGISIKLSFFFMIVAEIEIKKRVQ